MIYYYLQPPSCNLQGGKMKATQKLQLLEQPLEAGSMSIPIDPHVTMPDDTKVKTCSQPATKQTFGHCS